MITEITIQEGTQVKIQDNTIIVTGPKGELKRQFNPTLVEISVDGDKINFKQTNDKKQSKSYTGTMVSHTNNMIKGVNKEYTYKLKAIYSHFPMNISIQGDKMIIKNFAGEKKPRTCNIIQGAKVDISEKNITVTGINKEAVGQTAANMENATHIVGKDRRVFQDGIYIVEKGR